MLIDQLEALQALRISGTMAEAATRLRLSQSAISKRIQGLQQQLSYPLLLRKGRAVSLSPEAVQLLENCQPLLQQLHELLAQSPSPQPRPLVFGLSESLLSSWASQWVPELSTKLAEVPLQLHTHRGPVLLDRVRSGSYDLVLVAGLKEAGQELRSEHLFNEPMVVVSKGFQKIDLNYLRDHSLLSIEAHATTWQSLLPLPEQLQITHRLESFACAVQLAKAGYAHALVPLGIALYLGAPQHALWRTELERPIALVGRKSSFEREELGQTLAMCRTLALRAQQQARDYTLRPLSEQGAPED